MDERAEKVREIISREHIIALLYPVYTAEPPTNKLSQAKSRPSFIERGH